MPGLVPGIHVFSFLVGAGSRACSQPLPPTRDRAARDAKAVDGRDKPGHDEKKNEKDELVPPLSAIDHVLIAVADLDDARLSWERLGFTLTPRGRHLQQGTGNYC